MAGLTQQATATDRILGIEAGSNSGKSGRMSRSAGASPLCPQCGSQKLFKDGLRYLWDGNAVQRWLCRNCGYRFSEKGPHASSQPPQKTSDMSQHVSIIDTQSLKGKLDILYNRRVRDLAKEAKNLAAAEQKETVAGESPTTQQNAKGKLLQFMIKLQNEGIHNVTIQNYAKMLRLLMENGANLYDAESVKETIAKQKRWCESTKQLASIVYGKFAQLNGLTWKAPKYKTNRKIPFIPLESEVDSLIAHCGKKLSTLLRLLKESGIRVGEALRLEWKDIDAKNCTITLNNPEKYGICRMFQVSNELIAMLYNLPKKSDRIFGNRTVSSFEGSFSLQRRRAAIKLQNPRLLQIHFHTLRHLKATMEYAKTKDILHVMKVLGHRNIQTTLIYTQLINFESNDYYSATAETIEEAKQLIEAGFEFVCTIDKIQLFRKRK